MEKDIKSCKPGSTGYSKFGKKPVGTSMLGIQDQ